MRASPGIWYLFQQIPRLLAGPVSAILLLQISHRCFGYEPTYFAKTLALILSNPILLTILLAYDDAKNYFAARAVGARLPPTPRDYSPGGIYSIFQEIAEAESGYLGDGLESVALYCEGYTFNWRVLFQNRVVTLEPEHIKTVLSTQFDGYEKGSEVLNLLKPLLGSGVFSSDGEMWKFHRSMTRPFLTKDRITDFDNFERHATDAINQVKSRLREGYAVDMQDMAARFTLDSATEFLFGYDVRSLAAGCPYPFNAPPVGNATATNKSDPSMQFAKGFSDAQRAILSRARFSSHWPLTEFWKDEMEAPLAVINAMIDPIVQEAVARQKQSAKNNDTGLGVGQGEKDSAMTLLDHLVNSTDDPTIIRDEIMSLLVAGRDTTASTLTFVIYLLAQHPEVLDRLRQEILGTVGSQMPPTGEDIKKMRYLRAILNETLRLYPPVPFNMRMSKEAGLWPPNKPGGKTFYIPPNTRISYNVFGMHRRKDLWGPDALDFDPDRFLDERLSRYLTHNPFIFLPFNAGPRICVGQQFAYNEASFFLVRLLQNFSQISLATDAQPPHSRAPAEWAGAEGRKGQEKLKPKAHLTMYLEGGLWVTMQEAKP